MARRTDLLLLRHGSCMDGDWRQTGVSAYGQLRMVCGHSKCGLVWFYAFVVVPSYAKSRTERKEQARTD
jgi:hypothetical protein